MFLRQLWSPMSCFLVLLPLYSDLKLVIVVLCITWPSYLEAHFSTIPLSVVCDWSIHHISRLKWLWAKSTQWSIVEIETATFCTAAWVGSNLISRAVCGSGVWRRPWARRLTLTAPEELAVALRGWPCHRCVNGWMLAYIVKHWVATS